MEDYTTENTNNRTKEEEIDDINSKKETMINKMASKNFSIIPFQSSTPSSSTPTSYMSLILLLLSLLILLPDKCHSLPPKPPNPLKFGVHAQAEPSTSLIVGSVLTTNGLKAAIHDYANSGPETTHYNYFDSGHVVPTFYPFDYRFLGRGGGC